MTKARTKKATAVPNDAEQSQVAEPLDPKKVHELFGLHGPYEPPPPPTRPSAGRNRVSTLAVPLRTYSCG